LLACGNVGNRRAIEIPTGHQLRSSREAIQTFGWIAKEAGRISGVKGIEGILPDRDRYRAQRGRERHRIGSSGTRLHEFWHDYLLGRDGNVGIELLTATDAYRDLMRLQINTLDLRPDDRVLDVGAGTGDFAIALASSDSLSRVRVIPVDFIHQALVHGRNRLSRGSSDPISTPVVADLDITSNALPFADASCDAALGSLVIGYLSDAEALLRELHRVLKPGGRIVLSNLRPDADFSKLYEISLAQRYSSRPIDVFGSTGESSVDRSLPHFLNAAARILDLEERGRFQFFGREEIKELLDRAGFRSVRVVRALGDPPQALLASGKRS